MLAGKCKKIKKTMINRLLILTILIMTSVKGLCNENLFSSKTYGNLNVRVNGDEKIYTDNAYKSAEFCSYLTTQLFPNKKVCLEIYTSGIDDNEDFFVSYGNGKKEVFYNYDKEDRRGKVTKIRRFSSIDSLEYNGIVIRYLTKNPDYKKLMRLMYSAINQIDFIKDNQKELKYDWQGFDWTFSSVDTIVTKEWINTTKYDKLIANTLKNKIFISEACKNENEFAFSYQCSTDEYKIYSKTDSEFKNIVFKELIWFNIIKDYGVFVNSDSTFYIADSNNKTISNLINAPIKFSNFKDMLFLKKSENVLHLYIHKINKNHKDEFIKWFYLIDEKKLITEPEMEKRKTRQTNT